MRTQQHQVYILHIGPRVPIAICQLYSNFIYQTVMSTLLLLLCSHIVPLFFCLVRRVKKSQTFCLWRNYSQVLFRDAFNKLPDFFVQAFKIVVDSWEFSILLLYILWDDWPIFMILRSNEQLQQQLEYTLLNPDCHSWWASKMQSDTLEERYAIKLCFKLGKNATGTYGMLQTAFRPSCRNRASVFVWHKRFKEARESVRDDERCGRSKEVNTPELIGQRLRFKVTMLRF